MYHRGSIHLTLLAFTAIAVPVRCNLFNSLDKKDCTVGLEGFCVDSTDFTASSNDDFLAFATSDPVYEPLTFSNPDSTDFGTDLWAGGLGEPYSMFSDYDNLYGFQLADTDNGWLKCDCPAQIETVIVRKVIPLSK